MFRNLRSDRMFSLQRSGITIKQANTTVVPIRCICLCVPVACCSVSGRHVFYMRCIARIYPVKGRLSQVGFKYLAAGGVLEAAYGFFFYLAYTLASQVERFSYFFQRHSMLAAKAEIKAYNVSLARGECL